MYVLLNDSILFRVAEIINTTKKTIQVRLEGLARTKFVKKNGKPINGYRLYHNRPYGF